LEIKTIKTILKLVINHHLLTLKVKKVLANQVKVVAVSVQDFLATKKAHLVEAHLVDKIC
jgi:hypothetical protein